MKTACAAPTVPHCRCNYQLH